MEKFDGVVIGAGHNGLTLAAYLARAGLKIAVIERNPHIGGGCTTEEPALAGYRFNLHSNFFMGLRHSPLIHDLELYRFGFSYIEPPIQQGAAFRDGTCIVIHKDLYKTCASLARFSAGDAETFRALHFLYAVKMRPLFTSIAFNAPLPIEQLKDRLSGAQAKEFLSHVEFDSDINRAFNIFFGMDDIEQVRSCFDHCAADKFPHVLMGNGACNSAVDPTYAPTNGHSAFWWPFAPYAVDGDPHNWDRQRDDYTERVLGVWREYASNLDDSNVRAKLLIYATRYRTSQCQHGPWGSAHGRLYPVSAWHQSPPSLAVRNAHADRGTLSLRIVDRQRRRH